MLSSVQNYLTRSCMASYLSICCYTIFLSRKKKKDKESKHRLEQVVTSQNEEEVKTKKTYIDKRTPAQIAFDKMQEKRVSYQHCRANVNSQRYFTDVCIAVLTLCSLFFPKANGKDFEQGIKDTQTQSGGKIMLHD